jgi:[calcium/calmodulin-dependent protein kinase] kinase
MKRDDFTGEFHLNDFYKDEKKKKYDYSEDELRDILRQIVLGLDYLHENNVIHRDIKPDNILIDDNGHCKITDFNVSHMGEGEEGDKVSKKVEGTMFFYAPECCEEDIKEFAGKPLDIWALGVTTYILTFKKLPFELENQEDILGLLDHIMHGQ